MSILKAACVNLADQNEKENTPTNTRPVPNWYSAIANGTSAMITFQAGGWEFRITRGGLTCQRQPSPH